MTTPATRCSFALLLLTALLGSACKDTAVPSPPLALSATVEPGAVRLSWFAPEEDGGSPITGYRVDVEPREPALTVSVDGTSAHVSGLRARASYRFTVAAENAAGAVGLPASVGLVQVPDVPDAPTGVVAERGDEQVHLTWVAPSDGGLPLLRYVVTSHPGGARLETSGPEPTLVVRGLTNGEPHTFTVQAVNAVGEGPASTPTAPVVPGRPPDAPGLVSATPSVRGATVSWQAPTDTGGLPLLGYVVTASPGDTSVQVEAATTEATLTGLENDTVYTLTVTALNDVGPGLAASAAPVRTPALPGAPSRARATPGERSLLVTWGPPASDGRMPLTGYTVRAAPSGLSVDVGPDARSATVEPLSSTWEQSLTVTARNAVGEGSEARVPVMVRPHAAPVEVTSLALDASVTGGCVSLSYGLRQRDGDRADVLVEVDTAGDGTFTRATQAGSTTHSGLSALATSTEGTTHTFLWNRPRDVPGAAPSARVRLTATAHGSVPSTRTLSVPLEATSQRCEWDLDASPVSAVPTWANLSLQIAHGDFDRDGKQDLLSLGLGEVLRGLGNGRFSAPMPAGLDRFLAGSDVYATADFDGDGWLDVIAGSYFPGSDSAPAYTDLQVVLGLEGGSFKASWQPHFAGGFSAYGAPRAHDLDRDGTPELVLSQGGLLKVLRYAGDGKLAVAFTGIALAKGPPVVGDFNEDGREDVLVVGESLHAFYGQSLLTFTPELLGPLGSTVYSAVTADFDGDSHLDLAVIMAKDAALELYLLSGDGQGRFGAPVPIPTPTRLYYLSRQLTHSDVDGDGHQDLVWLDTYQKTLVTLRGRGDGTFEPTTWPIGEKNTVTLADLDGSGRPDVLMGGNSHVRMLRDLAAEPSRVTFGEAPVTADFDGDGWDDVASLPGGTSLHVHLTRAGGESVRRATSVPDDLVKLMPGRFDADATVDLLAQITDNFRDDLVLLRGRGDGTFAPAEVLPTGGRVMRSAVGDVDGDGDLDVACTTQRFEGSWRFELRLMLGRGDGTFGPASVLLTSFTTPELALGDLNADGRAELVALRNLTSSDSRKHLGFLVFRGGADGTLTELPVHSPSTYRCSDGFGSFARGDSRLLLEDLDGDGHTDVTIACDLETGGVITSWGQGQLGFNETAPAPLPGGARGLVARDVDGDGRKDLVVASPKFDSACLIRAQGPRSFEAPRCFATLPDTRDVAVLDVDHDGVLEVLAGSRDKGPTPLLHQR